jgi:hypothetical protein
MTVHGPTLEEVWGRRTVLDLCPVRWPVPEPLWTRGQMLRHKCGRITCAFCVRGRVNEVRDAVRLTQPDALVTVTGLTDNHGTNRGRMNDLAKRLRCAVGADADSLAWVWAAEPNPQGTGVHAHAWLRGPLPEPGLLDHHASAAGLGSTNLRPVTYDGDLAYMCKTATWNHASLAAYLEVNGGEIMHAGQWFWRDPTTGDHLSRKVAARIYRRRTRGTFGAPSDGR